MEVHSSAAFDLPPRQRLSLLQSLIFLTYTLTIFLTFLFPTLRIGPLPMRSFLVVGLLMLLSLSRISTLQKALTVHRTLISLIFGFGILGIIVSAVNGTDPATITQAFLEIHVQSFIVLILASVVCEYCGSGPTGRALIIAVGGTLIVAIFQYLDIGWSWDIRKAIGDFQGEVFEQYGYFNSKRPMGLSFTPVTLATQLCLAFAAYTISRQRFLSSLGSERRVDTRTVIATILFIVACFASGNRSPILGGLLFLLIYMATRRPGLFLLVAPFAVTIGILVLPDLLQMLSDTGSRVTSVDDKSATGRITLYYYGWRLFQDWPIGYGLAFNPVDHWSQYWNELRSMPNAQDVQSFPLHNYILNMLNFYGVGMMFLIPLMRRAFSIHAWTILFFTPYIVHILFHNAGPFWDDSLVWIVVAVARGPRNPAIIRTRWPKTKIVM